MVQFTLRPFQQDLLKQVHPLLEAGKRVMVQSATGSGKTDLALSVCEDYLERGYRVVWLVDRRELVYQALERGRARRIPMFQSYQSTGPTWHDREINVNTNASCSVKKGKAPPSDAETLLVIDEAHHTPATTYAQIIAQHQGPVLGVTATPWRLTKKEGFTETRFGRLFDELVQGPSIQSLIGDGFLRPMEMKTVPPLREVQDLQAAQAAASISRTGDYSKDTLAGMSAAASGAALAAYKWVLAQWPDRASDSSCRALLYLPTQESAASVTLSVAELGRRVGLLVSDDEKLALMATADQERIFTERPAVVDMFRNRQLDAVVSVNMLTEGFDAPGANTVIFARPTKSLVVYKQAAGRAMRPDPQDPEPALFYDCTKTHEEFGHVLAEYPWSLEARGEEGEGEPPLRCCWSCQSMVPIACHECPDCGEELGEECEVGHFNWYKLEWHPPEEPGDAPYCTRVPLDACEKCAEDARIAAQIEQDKQDKAAALEDIEFKHLPPNLWGREIKADQPGLYAAALEGCGGDAARLPWPVGTTAVESFDLPNGHAIRARVTSAEQRRNNEPGSFRRIVKIGILFQQTIWIDQSDFNRIKAVRDRNRNKQRGA